MPPFDSLPDELKAKGRTAYAGLLRTVPHVVTAIEKSAPGHLLPVLAVSDFVATVLAGAGDRLMRAIDEGRFTTPTVPKLDALPDTQPEIDARHQRNVELALLAWHDLTGGRDTGSTLQALSDLADRLIRAAVDQVLAADAARHGDALAPPLILAMGKLGGHELNFSSDVDLVFVHADRNADARYVAMARQIIRWLDARSEAGQVYRVDVRLRPFGTSGALSLSLPAFERYLQSHARDWERYAYVKARVITGRPDERQRIEEVIERFVYRRYVDFGVFDALRATKALIAKDVARKDREHDLKRGAGGIREIEFIAQAFQILRGGQRPALKTTSLVAALGALGPSDLPDGLDPDQLLDAYTFLRHVENRLQIIADQQTHVLPAEPLARARIAAATGMTVADLMAALSAKRAYVESAFGDVIAVEARDEERHHGHALLAAAEDQSALAARVKALIGAPDEDLVKAVHGLATARGLQRLDSAGRDRLDRLAPLLLDAALGTQQPARTVNRLTRVLVGVGRRSAYFSLLIERPATRQRLVDLCAASRRITNDVAQFPLLLDSLIGLGASDLPTSQARGKSLDGLLGPVADGDLDVLIDTVARFKSTAQFEVAVADLSRQLPVMQVSDHLTDIAEHVLGVMLTAARQDLARRYGELPAPADQFCVVAYGKLGGIELGYGSDLDLVFLYDGPEVDSVGEARTLSTGPYFARLVQRIVGLVTATTRDGALYEVDMRLRPSGNSGPLVSRLAAYSSYQRSRAWTWEHQALLRARAVAGSDDLRAAFEALRREVLCQTRDPSALKQDVVAMRTRLQNAHKTPAAGFDVKTDRGGLTDVEFLIQFSLLSHATAEPALVHYSDHVRHLDTLIDANVLGADVGEDLMSIYLAYRTWLHRRALDDGARTVTDGRFDEHRQRILALWRALLE